jgi:hypothetical protein
MKRSKEIVITPTRVVTALIVFLMLVTAGFVIAPRIPALFAKKSTGLTAEASARAGVEAFLSVDAKAGRQAWINKVCQASTPTGCEMTGKLYAPMLWPSVEKQGLRLSCKASSASLVTSVQESAESEIWELGTTCTNLDTGETDQSTTQVIVTRIADAGWKFERIRFDQEINQ